MSSVVEFHVKPTLLLTLHSLKNFAKLDMLRSEVLDSWRKSWAQRGDFWAIKTKIRQGKTCIWAASHRRTEQAIFCQIWQTLSAEMPTHAWGCRQKTMAITEMILDVKAAAFSSKGQAAMVRLVLGHSLVGQKSQCFTFDMPKNFLTIRSEQKSHVR